MTVARRRADPGRRAAPGRRVDPRPPPGPEQRLVTRTWRVIAAQTAVVFAVAILALDGLAIGLVLYTSGADTRARVAQALDDPDAITVPPPGVWVYARRDGTLRTSPGARPAPVDPMALDRVAAGRPDRVHETVADGREYLVGTRRDGRTTVQVALDLGDADRAAHQLYLALGAAGATGLVLAALVGALIARRAITPLGLALDRQHRFVADASHELRTPLTQLHTRAQLLEREDFATADPHRVAADIAQLVRGTRQMGELVEELLLAAQLRTEPRHFGPVDLASVAADAVAAEAVRSEQHRVSVRTVTAPGTHLVRGVVPALRRVLTALLDNAFSHTPPDGHIEVEVAGDPRGRTVVCTVRDDGAGFEPAQAHRIFERFARGHHSDSRRFGLGLALVREVVDAHGGTVTATAEPGYGAAFTITLPAWRPDAGSP